MMISRSMFDAMTGIADAARVLLLIPLNAALRIQVMIRALSTFARASLVILPLTSLLKEERRNTTGYESTTWTSILMRQVCFDSPAYSFSD